MPALTPFLVWAQAGPAQPEQIPAWLFWLLVWGEPSITIPGALGGLMTWTKVVALFCLLGWTFSWIMAAIKEPGLRGTGRLDVAALIALVGGLVSVLLRVLETNGRIRPLNVGPYPAVMGIAVACGFVLFLWVETKLWGSIRRSGTATDQFVLVGMHLALALGIGVTLVLHRASQGTFYISPAEAIISGGRLAVTYMGFVVLARVLSLVLPEIAAVRGRRLYSIAWQCWTEAFRRMWAPWVVVVIFGVILAFTSWFLTPPRPAELGRLYVGTLSLLCSLLLTITVAILAPISLPNDIRQQTIYTVVSKPVRRLELVWGRMIGYMALVTMLLTLFAGVSLLYFNRMIGAEIRKAEQAAAKAEKANRREFAQQFREQAEQLRTRMSARVPVKGVLSFRDSKGKATSKGIDVGQELEFRSFIEGASPSMAIWRFGSRVRDPYNPRRVLDRVVPVDQLLRRGTIEELENRIALIRDDAEAARVAASNPQLKVADNKRLTATQGRAQDEVKALTQELEGLKAREKSLRGAGKAAEANALHSPPFSVEMSFNVYRTTKGVLGEPVYASIAVKNPRPGVRPHQAVLPIREYYTNKALIPSRVLVGSHGDLTIEMQCLSPNQYLGMAESDLFLLSSEGSFEVNFLKGLFGVWLQAMVLTAIGVCVGTFLSWPVALLATIWFFVAGQVGFTTLQQFALTGDLVGGGPFVSLIRLLSHDNQVTDLAPTPAVVVAKTLDSIVMPVMSRLVYLVPNFSALDVTNVVAEGFAVTLPTLAGNLLLALAYALPFSIAGYFILKNREVAA